MKSCMLFTFVVRNVRSVLYPAETQTQFQHVVGNFLLTGLDIEVPLTSSVCNIYVACKQGEKINKINL